MEPEASRKKGSLATGRNPSELWYIGSSVIAGLKAFLIYIP